MKFEIYEEEYIDVLEKALKYFRYNASHPNDQIHYVDDLIDKIEEAKR